jgi:hypothetical protein
MGQMCPPCTNTNARATPAPRALPLQRSTPPLYKPACTSPPLRPLPLQPLTPFLPDYPHGFQCILRLFGSTGICVCCCCWHRKCFSNVRLNHNVHPHQRASPDPFSPQLFYCHQHCPQPPSRAIPTPGPTNALHTGSQPYASTPTSPSTPFP